MNSDISTKLNEILSDPEKLSSVMGAVSSVMASQPSEAPKETGAEAPKITLPQLPTDDRVKLLEAIKPFVAEEKREKVDKLIRMITLGSLAGTFKNLL